MHPGYRKGLLPSHAIILEPLHGLTGYCLWHYFYGKIHWKCQPWLRSGHSLFWKWALLVLCYLTIPGTWYILQDPFGTYLSSGCLLSHLRTIRLTFLCPFQCCDSGIWQEVVRAHQRKSRPRAWLLVPREPVNSFAPDQASFHSSLTLFLFRTSSFCFTSYISGSRAGWPFTLWPLSRYSIWLWWGSVEALDDGWTCLPCFLWLPSVP